jgi:hypothetical protein
VATPTEGSVGVVAVEIQDAQTAKTPFGSDAVADNKGDANPTHTAGTSVVRAPNSLKQIFSKGRNFENIEQSVHDQGRVHMPIDFSREVLSPKRFFKAPNAAVADLMRLLMSASEVREQ